MKRRVAVDTVCGFAYDLPKARVRVRVRFFGRGHQEHFGNNTTLWLSRNGGP